MTPGKKRDFGTLSTARILSAALADYEASDLASEKAETLARIILDTFEDYYTRSRKIPWLAKEAFETRDWPRAIELSQERISIFSVSISKAAPILKKMIGENDRIDGFWDTVEERYRDLIKDRYEADLALAYLASMRRRTYRNIWDPIAPNLDRKVDRHPDFLRHFETPGEMTPELVMLILAVPGIEAPFRDLEGDAGRVSERINRELDIGPRRRLGRVEVVEAGFYRNRGAYILGAVEVGGETGPMALALLHREGGVEVDAVILREITLRHVFSSMLANLHVTVTRYHELVDYLYGLMPVRPRGEHYSTIGYNHIGKIAVMEQITTGLEESREALDHAPGPRGSVAIGFTSPATEYVLKVIRDKPTEQYKWGDDFKDKESVMVKYRNVHEENRSGSMLDNIIYSNLWLPRKMFRENLLNEMLEQASETITSHGDKLFFEHLIVQRKMIPVPLYLQDCTREEAEMVVIRLGQCIRNNAATNLFNKDLDGRNYGVSSLRFVYLFDYDAVEVLTDVKVRTNLDAEDGEEGIPEWYFEDGIVFLPEEIEAHLRLPDSGLRRLFREAHGELLTVEYWTRMQRLLNDGYVPRVRTYPRSTQLTLDGAEDNLTLSPRR